MSYSKVLENLACVVCTKDRPEEIRALLSMVKRLPCLPGVVVIVDSSLTKLTEAEVLSATGTFPAELIFIKSLPGAPHQKNVGLDYLYSRFAQDGLSAVCLIDDDIELPPFYFENVLKLLSSNPDAACIGGFDVSNPHPRGGLLRRITGLAGGEAGKGRILKSGIALPPQPVEDLELTTWVPGFTQNFPWHVARSNRFDGRIRIYGDEVEFQLRIAEFGRIYVSKNLGVKHLSSVTVKDSYRDQQAYMDAFRWSLATRYPNLVSASFVLFTTICLALGEAGMGLLGVRKYAWSGFLGHIDFLGRLLSRKPTQQYVKHGGSGPFATSERS